MTFIFEPRIDFLNLYALNLSVYTNAQVIAYQKFDDLLSAFKQMNADVIIANLSQDDQFQDNLDRLDLLLKKKMHPPMCFIFGESKKIYNDIQIFDQNIPVKNLVVSLAKKKGITAKYMSELDLGEYYPIPARFLLPGWQATKPIFILSANKQFKLSLKEGDIFTAKILKDMGEEGEFYCLSKDRLDVINAFIGQIKTKLEDPTLTLKEKTIENQIAFNMISESVASIGLPETTLQLAKTSIKSMGLVARSTPSIKKLYNDFLNDLNSLRYKKSIITTHLGQFLLKDQSWNNPNVTMQWSYLCFFHDIYLTQDEFTFYRNDKDVLDSDLSPKEKETIINHAQMAAILLSQVKDAPVGIDMLLKQHHGSKMGNSLSDTSLSISPLCVLFILVEEYAQFLLSNAERIKTEAESLLFIDELDTKYTAPNFKKMVALLRTIPFHS